MKGLIFDLDGVIIHTDHFHYLAWKQMCETYGLKFDETLNHRLRGVSRMESLEIILEHNQQVFPNAEKSKMTNLKNEIYKTSLQQLKPSDVAKEVLDTLLELKKRGYKLAIGSSSKNAKFILKQIGLDNLFDVISDGTNIEKSKPDPEVFLKAAKWLHLEPKDCAVIEDAIAGLMAAKSGNMVSIGIGDAKDSEFADFSLHTFKDLLNLF